MKTCGIRGCSRERAARGLCQRHYQSWRSKGRAPEFLGFEIPGPRPTRFCSLNGCERVHYARGFCHRHYWRFKEHGHPGPLGLIKTPADDTNLPNPWVNVAPSCPKCRTSAFLWADEDSLPWFCPPCRRRFAA